ncbi:hypothetical protein FS837_002460 [Tulasnella sp. UAMH 9824]|nr:hypothetical protein FS837_002460 [Tulasnella sp. UAMH 9824]
MTELKIGRKAVRAIARSKDADLLVVQFKPDAVPPPEEILGFFEKVGGIQQLHFFTPSYAKVGRPAYYLRNAEPLGTTAHGMGHNGPQDDILSDVPEVDEEMRKSALRFLMPARFVEAAREQASLITSTGTKTKGQGRKRKRDGAEEQESLAIELVGDASDSKVRVSSSIRVNLPDSSGLINYEKEKKRLKRQQKTGNVERVHSVDHKPNLASNIIGTRAINGEETAPETKQLEHSSYTDTSPEAKKLKKRERSGNLSVLSDAVDSSVQTTVSSNPTSQSNTVADDSTPGDAKKGSGRNKEGKRKHKREPIQPNIPQEDVNIDSSEPFPSEVADRSDGVTTARSPALSEPSTKEKERKKKSKKKGHDKQPREVPHTSHLIPDFKTRAWSPSEPLDHQVPPLEAFQSELKGKFTYRLNRTADEPTDPGLCSIRNVHVREGEKEETKACRLG